MQADWPIRGADLTGRCFLCGGALRRSVGPGPCRLCGAVQVPGTHAAAARRRAALLTALLPGRWRAPASLAGALDDAALGMAAGLRGLAFMPDVRGRARGGAAAGRLVPALASPSRVTVVILARADEEGARRRAREASGWADDVLLMLDGEGRDGREGAVRWTHRPLDGDFAAQRNAAQAEVRTRWALHLDSDERPDARLLAGLSRAIGTAEREGRRAVGLPRVNRVDGTASVLFPDTQYRLLRRTERFVGAVHERPAACADPRATTQWLAGGLIHEIDAGHVAARKARYDAMGQAPAQAREASELLTAFPTRG